MNKNLIDAQDVFLGKINQLCNKFGLNNIMAQLYSILYLNSKALSLDDMVEQLKISKATVSINIRVLERYGAVRRVWVKGSRKDYYEAETDISKVIMDRIRSMAQRRMSEIDDMINSSSQILDSVNSENEEDKESIKIFRDRLDQLKGLYSQAQTLFNLFNSGLLGNLRSAKINRKDKKEVSISV